MDKATLKQYSKLKQEVEQLIRLIKMTEDLIGASVQRLDGLPKTFEPGDPVGNIGTKAADLFISYRARLERLLTLQCRIEKAIDALEDTAEREVLQAKYLEGKTWEQVGEEVHYSYRQLHRIHGRALEKISSF